MANPKRIALIATIAIIAVALVVLAGSADPDVPREIADYRMDADPAGEIERGKYLAIAGNCGSCHTADAGAFMAGGLAFETPFGTVYSTNITPDPMTGIGDWSPADFYVSMRHGLRPGGEHLYPVFPYTNFTRLTDGDVLALYAYLQTLTPVDKSAPENDLAFPFSLRPLLALWKAFFFRPEVFRPHPSQSPQWNRGAYLVEALAHCGACHSPRNLLGAEKAELALPGGYYSDRVPGGQYQRWSAPNLTGAERGLGLWPHGELVAYLQTGRNSFLETFGPMNEVIINSTSKLAPDDVEAMAGYLKSLPARMDASAEAAPATVMGRGRTVYNLHCGTCHLPTGLGDPEMAPKLDRGSLVVQNDDPASMINVILYGPELPDRPVRWRQPMDEHRYILDDEEVAAVATFVRNSWGNAAGLVTPEQVQEQR